MSHRQPNTAPLSYLAWRRECKLRAQMLERLLTSSTRLMGADASYSSSSNWHTSFPTPSESTSGHSMPTSQPTESGAEYVVPCPYNCGTVLTGVHAVGNMTRHLKSQNCVGSGKEKPRYICPVKGCDKRYIRSDGLKVHLRKRHNISQPNDKAGGSDYAEGGYGYS